MSKSARNRPDVLVRAFQGEPVRLHMLDERDGVIEVYRDSEQKTLGVHSSTVYRFDEATFKKLRDAYLAGDRERLEKIWANCPSLLQAQIGIAK